MSRVKQLPAPLLWPLALALSVLALACASGETETPASGPAPTQPAASQPTTAPPQQGGATASPTPAAASQDAPDPKAPQGTIVLAWANVPPGPGINSAQTPEIMMGFGVTELFFRQSKDNPVEPWLATEYELAPDLSKVTVKFREGVMFHKGFGELTAEDVAWSLNDTNAATNPSSIHGQAGDYAALVGEARALDKTTLELPIVTWDVRFASYFMNQSGDGFGIFSKKAFDQNGAEWMRENVVATGPFEVQQWLRNDRAVLKAVQDHWDATPQISEMRVIQVPEAQSRVAMLLTGEADIAHLPTKDLVEVPSPALSPLARAAPGTSPFRWRATTGRPTTS